MIYAGTGNALLVYMLYYNMRIIFYFLNQKGRCGILLQRSPLPGILRQIVDH